MPYTKVPKCLEDLLLVSYIPL